MSIVEGLPLTTISTSVVQKYLVSIQKHIKIIQFPESAQFWYFRYEQTSQKMSEKDIRWKQRFSNYIKAFNQLSEAVELANQRALSKLERQGLIQSFEYTHELAWQVLRDFFMYQGNPEIRGSRDATREAFQNNLIDEGDVWMDMIKSRNLTSHTYNEEVASEIAEKVSSTYYDAFEAFKLKMEALDAKDQ